MSLCDVVVAQFVFGAQRCGKPATGTTRCEDPTCAFQHPVCPEHGGVSEVSLGGT